MGKRLFVGNLPFTTTADELRSLFSQHGTVTDVHIVVDRETSRPRGFAFVSFATDEEALKATDALNGRSVGGRPLVVKDARDRGAPPPPGERGPRPAGDRPPRPGGGPGMGGPRPGGPPRDGAGGPSRPWTPRPPRGPSMPPPEELPQEGERRRFATKKRKPGAVDGERVPKVRPRAEEEESRAGNWRQWIDDDDEEDSGLAPDADVEDEGDVDEAEEDGPVHAPDKQ